MDVSTLVRDRNSEDEFANDFMNLVASGCSIIHVRSHEVGRAVEILRNRVLMEGDEYREWDVLHGIRQFELQNFEDPRIQGDNDIVFASALEKVWNNYIDYYTQSEAGRDISSLNNSFNVFVNAHFFWDKNPQVQQRFIDFSQHLSTSNIIVVLVSPDVALPDEVADFVNTVDLTRPGHGELVGKAETVFRDIEDQGAIDDTVGEAVAEIAISGAGMTGLEFETALSKAIVVKCGESDDSVANADDLITQVRNFKTEIVKKNDLLEIMTPESMGNVGGMEHLKEWVSLRAATYSDEAREFGIEPPKGVVLVGVPGTGKSLAAKAVSSEFGIPLVRLDFSKVFNALVGSSEQRMRMALSMVEAMSPCVCFADEIDKGLGGIANGGGDAGTSMRVLGTFLTWLQESKSPVFTMVTANNVNGLPPELLRRGRFDAIFSTTLPTVHERKEVLKIHLEKRGWSIDDFKKTEIDKYIAATDGYVPAEIEATVKDGLVLGFNSEEREFKVDHLMEAAKGMVPLSKSHAEAIAAMVSWSQQNAIPASFNLEEYEAANGGQRRTAAKKSTGNVRRLDTGKTRSRRKPAPKK